MFGLFTRGKQENKHVAMLRLADPAYAAAMRELFAGMDPSARAHVLVARRNLTGAIVALAAEDRMPPDQVALEKFIPIAAARMADSPDDIVSRRWSWFLFAALLARLEKLAAATPAIAEAGAEIWCAIVADAPRLKQLLPGNVIWKPQEKAGFDLDLADAEFVEWALGHAVPPAFSRTEAVARFVRSRTPHPPGQDEPGDRADGAL
jgi:hypothetical protein